MNPKQAYNGKSRKLVLAFDVGTTFSGVSYAILDPGSVPKVCAVTRYPSKENAGGDSKIPTIIYYDRNGAVKAVGAEAKRDDIVEQARDEGWTKAEWFKLHLRPKSISAEHVRDSDIPPLPPRKTVVDVFADFLKYLFECVRDYIQENEPNGTSRWRSFEKEIEFVLAHPNGWEGQQQSQMRRAAIQAGLVPEGEESHSRLQFVTEGEASLHFCVAKLSSESTPLQVGQGSFNPATAAQYGAAAVAGIVLAPVIIPPVLGIVGFSATGVVAGSIAAGIQSSIGLVTAGSPFAVATSIAMGGAVPVGVQAAVAVPAAAAAHGAMRLGRRLYGMF